MSEETPIQALTIEQVVASKFTEVRSTCEIQLAEGKQFVREQPEKAILYALASGYVLRLLPIGGLIRTVANVLLFAVKPLAVFYGVAKGYEILQRSKR